MKKSYILKKTWLMNKYKLLSWNEHVYWTDLHMNFVSSVIRKYDTCDYTMSKDAMLHYYNYKLKLALVALKEYIYLAQLFMLYLV